MENATEDMINKRLIVLVEAQSIWTVNIILRALMYLARTYQDYIGKEELNVYSSKAPDLPEPEMYVIYTGSRKIEKEAITLSEEFFGGRKTNLDVTVHVLTDGKASTDLRELTETALSMVGHILKKVLYRDRARAPRPGPPAPFDRSRL